MHPHQLGSPAAARRPQRRAAAAGSLLAAGSPWEADSQTCRKLARVLARACEQCPQSGQRCTQSKHQSGSMGRSETADHKWEDEIQSTGPDTAQAMTTRKPQLPAVPEGDGGSRLPGPPRCSAALEAPPASALARAGCHTICVFCLALALARPHTPRARASARVCVLCGPVGLCRAHAPKDTGCKAGNLPVSQPRFNQISGREVNAPSDTKSDHTLYCACTRLVVAKCPRRLRIYSRFLPVHMGERACELLDQWPPL